MTIKRKMSMGILAGALGLSLIGGGTWAAFNDVEEVNNSLLAGTLNLEVGEGTTFDFPLKTLKPGDSITSQLVLENAGSLDINDILVDVEKLEGWKDKDELELGITNTEDEFLQQFSIVVKKGETAVYTGTLKDLVYADFGKELTGTKHDEVGIEKDGSLTLDILVTFVDNPARIGDTRHFVQNKYQGEQSNLRFVFEATQMPGEER
ncbi:hypothetical protein A8F94_02910 [Bacillus sp. FJAT-27225]|uniref:TasA family protein n=1 Tax=Bacillus sp. FJAT-27225 TaxID=1743144 RepID=UPI00080C2660|nr:TasA family protein [Bacillus sp. FJAT-27225]OCA90839.1 hypothetical protein A8F94_02910 [Bacillus sp. FJAT-27225]